MGSGGAFCGCSNAATERSKHELETQATCELQIQPQSMLTVGGESRHSGRSLHQGFSFSFSMVKWMDVLPAGMSVHHLYAWCPWSPKRVSGPLRLELQTVVSHLVGAGNETLALPKSNQG